MRSFNARQVVFGLMLVAVVASAFAYAGSSTPWAGSAYALVIPSASSPAPPIVSVALATPTSLMLTWEPDMTGDGAIPDVYRVVIDSVDGPVMPASPRELILTSLVPGSVHKYQVLAGRTGYFGTPMWSDPTKLVVTQPNVEVVTPPPVVEDPPPAPLPVALSTPRVSGKATARRGTWLTGAVSPSHSTAVRIEVQVLAKKKYKRYKTFSVGSAADGVWKYKAKLKRGAYRIRELSAADGTYGAGASGWRKVVVK